ncbi:MAG: hypothetical protein JWO53_128 [Chlamydiia bacterium]|nr:hypothetical protein [Chlamydiia bacterium]
MVYSGERIRARNWRHLIKDTLEKTSLFLFLTQRNTEDAKAQRIALQRIVEDF